MSCVYFCQHCWDFFLVEKTRRILTGFLFFICFSVFFASGASNPGELSGETIMGILATPRKLPPPRNKALLRVY